MLDLIIKDCQVIDGTGKPAFTAEVGISAGRVVTIREKIEQDAVRTITAAGLCLAPGFIDPHTHSDVTLLVDRNAESKIRQGVTTEIIGNCGSSPAPLAGASLEEALDEAKPLGLEITWTSMAEYIACLKNPGVALNVVPLVGHNTVRGAVLGFGEVQPTSAQQAEMERLVAEAIQQGARGLSTGLFYPPGLYATTGEVVGLARAAARNGGIYASHIRSESDGLFDAVEEALEIGAEAGARVEISHVKLEGYRNFSGVDRLIEMIERASLDGLQVGCDQYPYTASSTWLASILPNWAQAGGGKAVAARLRQPQIRLELLEDWENHREEWENRSGVKDWQDILITHAEGFPDLSGKSLAEAAREAGKDPIVAAFDLIAATNGQVGCVFFDQLEENVRALMRNPLVVVGSDGAALSPQGVLGQGKVHPRSYGTFPRVLGHYVREVGLLSLEEAVRKMTSITAERFGLADRGVIREGSWADLVLFDPLTVIDRATYNDPHQFPAGIPYVIVNGTVVIDDYQHTGALPGKVL